MNRSIATLAAVVAGLWALAAYAWLDAWPALHYSQVSCTAALERDTRTALASDPTIREIPTPVECQGAGKNGLADAIAAMTPIPVPSVAVGPTLPALRDTPPVRPHRTVTPSRRPSPSGAPTSSSPTPSVEPTPETPSPEPTSPTPDPTPSSVPSTSASPEEQPEEIHA